MKNKVNLIGRLGKDPEIKNLESGTNLVNFTLATSKKVKGEEQTQWHNVTAFGKTAEIIGKYCKKGFLLDIEGEIQYRKYTDKDGNNRSSTDIICFGCTLLPSKGESISGDSSSNAVTADDDLPF